MAEFEPRIVMFCCNWCSYAGADLAGVARLQYPTNTRVIRVMCSSRVQPTFILRALKEGADGVLVTGCHIGDCHYVDSNVHTRDRMEHVVDAMEHLGLEGRVRLEWISAKLGDRSFGRRSPSLSDRSRRLDRVRFGTRQNRRERESYGIAGGGVCGSLPSGVLFFQR